MSLSLSSEFSKLFNSQFRFVVFVAILLASNIKPISAQNWPGGMHDPSSIVKEGDRYWVFGTGDGIYSMYSDDLMTWQSGATPFTNGDYPAWIDKYTNQKDPNHADGFSGFFWAPDIIHMNGKYYLYYSASMWGTAFSCIGLVVNKTLDPTSPDYKWEDQGDIGIYSPRSGWSINAIDAAMMRGPDGRIWMTYGSFNRDGIMVTEVDSVSGKPIGNTVSVANSWTGGNNYGEGEGGHMLYRDGYYYMIYNKGGCCNGIASSYYMVIGRSENPQGPFVDKEGKNMRAVGSPSGGTLIFEHDDSRGYDDRYFGPGHFGLFTENGVDHVTFHYYNQNGFYPSAEANNQGGPTLGTAFLEWGEDGWPSISFNYLQQGVYRLTNVNSQKNLDLRNQSVDSGTFPYQYAADSTSDTQLWYFTPLGTGEYTIRSWADTTKYLETVAPDYDLVIKLTDNYTGSVNQKWRLAQDNEGDILIYPSIKDNVMEVANNTSADYRVGLSRYDGENGQQWKPTLVYGWPARIVVDKDEINVTSELSTDTIFIESNTYWEITITDPAWVSASATSGLGDAEVIITISENTKEISRSSVMGIQAIKGTTEIIFVNQEAYDPATVTSADRSPVTKISPNPTTGMVTLSGIVPFRVEIWNLSGQKLLTESKVSENHELNLTQLPKGVYVLKCFSENNTWSQRLIRK